MINDIKTQVESVDRQTIAELVRQIVYHDDFEVLDWNVAPISFYELNPTTGGLYRLKIAGNEHSQPVSWSVVLKIALEDKDNPDPSYWNYWKREFLAYQSGLLGELSGGLIAPRCYGVEERPDGNGWIWMEDINESSGPKWPLSRFGLAAYHLGEHQGQFLAGKPLPSFPWLSDGWLQGLIKGEFWSNYMDPDRPDNAWDISIVKEAFSPELVERIKELWTESDLYLDSLDRLPQTLCHLDAHRRNLMARQTPEGRDQTVAIDWAFVGPGAVGQDMGDLIAGTLFFLEVGIEEAKQLEELVISEYLRGLNEAGWDGDPRQVHLGYAAYSSLRTGATLPGWFGYLLDDDQLEATTQQLGQPVEVIRSGWLALTDFVLTKAEEAKHLIAAIR